MTPWTTPRLALVLLLVVASCVAGAVTYPAPTPQPFAPGGGL